MGKIIKVLALLISVSFCANASDSITFKELTKLVSEDIKKNIYLDKNITNYVVDFNIINHQEDGEIYAFYKIVLFEHDLLLEHNRAGDFFTIKERKKEYVPIAPVPVHEDLKLHYYTYKIRNITNEDVVNAMSIFPSVKFQYLKQSDIIAYSATRSDHLQVKKILSLSDNKVIHKTIKLTLFAINKKKLLSYGSTINAFNYTFDGTFEGIIDALRSSSNNTFNLKDSFSMGFTLHALEGHSIADIFQSPTMRLTNGVKSSVTSVVNVPYLQTTSTVDSTTNSVIEQFQYKDIGLQINVNPKIKNDWVYLDLDLISEELISLDDDKPITQKITYQNSVRITKGKPILLTGIKKKSMQVIKDGVPLLSDIPFLGELFKNQSTQNDEQNINILIEVL